MHCSVIIPAAGSGSRFGSPVPKQFLPLRGRPVLDHVVQRFLSSGFVTRVVISVSPSVRVEVEEMANRLSWKSVELAVGGATRQESVLAGLGAIDDDEALVAVHDAVRPFFRTRTLRKLLEAAALEGAAIPAGAIHDTVHEVTGDHLTATLDRDMLRAAQTPQCFRAGVLRRALKKAVAAGVTATDDAGAVFRSGGTVRVLAGDPFNIKITRAEDLAAAERNFDEWSSE